MSNTDVLLAVDWALTPSQRGAFLTHWYALNPNQRGAMVADVLEQLVDADANLDVTEPILEAWPNSSSVSGIYTATTLIRPAILALYYIEGRPPSQEEVLALVVDAMAYVGQLPTHPAPWTVQPLRDPPMGGIELIARERADQVLKHGHTAEHDREAHADGSLAKAAAAYAMAANGSWQGVELYPWPVDPDRAHPIQPVLRGPEGDDRRIEYLAAAGALCAAEIDRLLAERGA